MNEGQTAPHLNPLPIRPRPSERAESEPARSFRLLGVRQGCLVVQCLVLAAWIVFAATGSILPIVLVLGFILQGLTLVVYGSVIRRASYVGFGLVIVPILLFFVPYLDLQPVVGIIGIGLGSGFGIAMILRSQPWPDARPGLLQRSILLGALYGLAGLALWIGLALVSTTVYPLREESIAALASRAEALVAEGADQVVLSSQVNIAGRFFSLADGTFLRFSASSGRPLVIDGDQMICAPPYPIAPVRGERRAWLCRIMVNRWMFFRDFDRSYGDFQ